MADSRSDGVIEPKRLQSLALDSVHRLLLKALLVASAEEGSGEDFPRLVRKLLGVEEGYSFASLISDQFIKRFAENDQLTSRILRAFCKSKIGSLTRLDLPLCPDLNGETFCLVLDQHPLLELTVAISAVGNDLVDWQHLGHLSRSPVAGTLKSLVIQCDDEIDQDPALVSFDWLRSLTCLVRLDIHGMFLSEEGEHLGAVVEQLPNLSVLNLARTSLDDIQASRSNLKALSLSGVPVCSTPALFMHILQLRTLVSLDISKFEYGLSFPSSMDHNHVQKLSELPLLKYLDVSGLMVCPSDIDCFDPPRHRMGFLGLLNTQACQRKEFNCDMVSGDSNEQQFLTSLKTYRDREDFMSYALHKLFAFAEDGHLRILQTELVLALLPLFENQKTGILLLPASACLWHLTKEEHKRELSATATKHVIAALVKILERHLKNPFLTLQTAKNCALSLCHFLFPDEIMFIYSRMVWLLVGLLTNVPHKLVQSVAVSLMNGTVWQVSLQQKMLMKTAGGIEAALKFVEDKLSLSECDQALEVAWSFLWNVTVTWGVIFKVVAEEESEIWISLSHSFTMGGLPQLPDETPVNSEELLRCNGLGLLIQCYKTFRNSETDGNDFSNMLRNMLGALGNVAEVKALRPKLLSTDLLEIFRSILLTMNDLEVQYNVSGILCNLAMESESLWSGIYPSKDYLLSLLETSVDGWSLTQLRNIQYRSLKPIIAVVNCLDDRVALWGVWALVNLCQVYPLKYCIMMKREGGMDASKRLLARATMPKVKELASRVLMILDNVLHFKPSSEDVC